MVSLEEIIKWLNYQGVLFVRKKKVRCYVKAIVCCKGECDEDIKKIEMCDSYLEMWEKDRRLIMNEC